MLKFKEFTNWLDGVNEANVWRNRSDFYITHPKFEKKVPNELVELVFTWTDDDIETLSAPKFYMVPKSGPIKEIDKTEAKSLLKHPKNSLMKTETDSNIYLIVLPDTQYLIKSKRSGETTTNVKEGMVIYFYYSDINTIPTEHNARHIISTLLNDIQPKISTEALDVKTMSEISNYLSDLSINKKTIGDLIDFWSAADLIKNRLGGNSYSISRNKIFNSIRTLGSRLSGFQADKWCPGDIYLIDPSVENRIPNYVSDISKNIQLDSIQKLNSLFRNEFTNKIVEEDPIIGSIIAISLKKEKAQAGKAKQFMKSLTPDEREYNVTKDELDMDSRDLIKAIEDYRKNIAAACKKSVTTINLIQDTGYTGKGDADTIQSKFASIKLANKLLSNPNTIDDNILKGVAFGMSLTGVNPTFFKVIGSTRGTASDEKYPAGEMIELMDAGLENPNSVITITDLNTNASVKFNLTIKKGEDSPKDIQFSCKPNGNTQATLEIEKSK